MKILFSLTYYSPYISGLTFFVKEIAEQMAKSGNNVSVLCFKHQNGLADKETLNQVNIIRVRPWLKISKGFISGEWITNSWLYVNQTDITVVNLPQAEGWITAAIAKLLGKKVIAIYLCQADTKNKLVNILLNTVNGFTLQLADKVVTLTKDYAENSRILTNIKNKLTFIYPLIAKQKVDKKWKVAARMKLGTDRIIIGVAARLAAEKGLEYFLETIPILKSHLDKNFTLAIAGPSDPAGEKDYGKKIVNIVDKYQENAIFLGAVPEGDMESFYSLLNLLVLPSINSTEAFGMVQVEAMFCGIPVIASDLPGVRIPIQKTGMGVIVPAKNSQKLAEAIIEVLNHRARYVKQRNVIENEFNYGKTRDQWKKLFLGRDD